MPADKDCAINFARSSSRISPTNLPVEAGCAKVSVLEARAGVGINVLAAAVAAVALLCLPAQAADQNLGRNIAAACATCHGTNGRNAGGMPALAGQPQQTLQAALREFRAGTRPATIMNQLAKGYTDAQIEAVAAYFAAQRAR